MPVTAASVAHGQDSLAVGSDPIPSGFPPFRGKLDPILPPLYGLYLCEKVKMGGRPTVQSEPEGIEHLAKLLLGPGDADPVSPTACAIDCAGPIARGKLRG